MIIKKFEADTEKDAIMLAKNELGKEAIVMNVKTVAPRGIYKLFRKTVVEVTAALDDNKQIAATDSVRENQNLNSSTRSDRNDLNHGFFTSANDGYLSNSSNDQDESAIEKKLNNLQKLIEKQMLEKAEDDAVLESTNKVEVKKNEEEDKNLECLRLVYNQLIENEVDEQFANQLISDFEFKNKKEASLDNILSAVYQKLVLKLGQVKTIELEEGKTKFIFFIGPTGVGKTTTIAKVASDFLLHKKVKVGLLTADTYRVAAVEQLRTYANILGIPIKVIYGTDEMEEAKKEFADFDIVLVDTAGRSHKNQQQQDDINRLISTVPEEERDVFLVLSATTKYKDLVKITEIYHEFTDYGLIFTKLDETGSLGNILNIKMLTNCSLSYATVGQNVPDDITQMNPQEIAKQLLGGGN